MPNKRDRWLALAVSSVLALTGAWIVLERLESRRARPDMRFHSPALLLSEAADANAASLRRSAVARNSLNPGRPEEWSYFLREAEAMAMYAVALENNTRYDPWTYYSETPGQNGRRTWDEGGEQEFWWRTNSLGLREDGELSDPPADRRVLVAGDSHTAGACNNSETFSSLLESELEARHPGRTVEVLNTAMQGFSFFQYEGTLHKFRDFAPQVFVVAVHGGNDFSEILYLRHYFRGAQPKSLPQEVLDVRNRALEMAKFAMAQCFNSIFDYRSRPDERGPALRQAVALCSQMHEICAQRGIEMVVVFLPAACDCRWRTPHENIRRGRKHLGLSAADAEINARLGEDFLARLAKRGIETVDMRPIFAREPDPPYWRFDLHLNPVGHRLVADALLPAVEAALAR